MKVCTSVRDIQPTNASWGRYQLSCVQVTSIRLYTHSYVIDLYDYLCVLHTVFIIMYLYIDFIVSWVVMYHWIMKIWALMCWLVYY